MNQHILHDIRALIDEKAVLQKRYDAAIDRLGKARVALAFNRSFVSGYSTDHPTCPVARQAVDEANVVLSLNLFGEAYSDQVSV